MKFKKYISQNQALNENLLNEAFVRLAGLLSATKKVMIFSTFNEIEFEYKTQNGKFTAK